MTTYFDETKWDEQIKDPLWYAGELYTECEVLMQQAADDPEHRDKIKKAIRSYFVDRLERGMVALATDGANEDAERQPIDTVVIHHTSGAADNYSLPYLNAVQLLRIYVPVFRSRPERQGKSLWSGHFYQGGQTSQTQQVFWGYHWLIFADGTYERILPDEAIGWHAGSACKPSLASVLQ